MDVVPKPDQVVSAAGNVAHRVLRGGLADLRTMPRTLVDGGELREVYHYRPHSPRPGGEPVLLVAPLAAPALCYDLRRGCSLVEHLLDEDHPTYLVEYGTLSMRDRSLGLEQWVDDVVPTAVRAVSAHAGDRPVHLVGWSLGGLFALLAAAADRGLPIASISVLGSPVDTARVPLVAPLRPLLDLPEGGGLLPRASQVLGATPPVRWASQLSSFQRLVTKPLAVATRYDDADYLAQLEAVERFQSQTYAYPGRRYGQLYHRFVRGNALAEGEIEVDGRTVRLADVSVPVLVVAGADDTIAPVPAVRAAVDLLTGSPEVRCEIVPGGHLGLVSGRRARHTTWPAIDEWVRQWSTTPVGPEPDAAASTGPRIGTSTRRRYGSEGSRSLAR